MRCFSRGKPEKIKTPLGDAEVPCKGFNLDRIALRTGGRQNFRGGALVVQCIEDAGLGGVGQSVDFGKGVRPPSQPGNGSGGRIRIRDDQRLELSFADGSPEGRLVNVLDCMRAK
jgi:hypothetical protein